MPTTVTFGASLNHLMLALERNETLQHRIIALLFGAIVLDLAYLVVFLVV